MKSSMPDGKQVDLVADQSGKLEVGARVIERERERESKFAEPVWRELLFMRPPG